MAPGSWAQQWVPSNSTRLFLLPRHSVQVRRSSPVAVLVFGLVLQTFLFNQFCWFIFSSTATTFALFMGAFPRQTGIRVRFQSFFLFILLSSTQQLKNIEYVIRVFWMRFMFQLFLQACDLPTPWPQMPPCPLYQVSKTFEPLQIYVQ